MKGINVTSRGKTPTFTRAVCHWPPSKVTGWSGFGWDALHRMKGGDELGEWQWAMGNAHCEESDSGVLRRSKLELDPRWIW